MTTDKLAAGGQAVCDCGKRAEWIIGTARFPACSLCHKKWLLLFNYQDLENNRPTVERILAKSGALRAGEGSQAAPPDALEQIRALRVWAAAKADTHEECGSRTLAAMFMVKRDTLDSVIDILKGSAAAAGSGTFAEGCEASAKLLDTISQRLRDSTPPEVVGSLNAAQYAKAIRALAQEKREPAPAFVLQHAVQHGVDCPKARHTGDGYLHDEKDDTPYNVDGILYCGRCHVWMYVLAPDKSGEK